MNEDRNNDIKAKIISRKICTNGNGKIIIFAALSILKYNYNYFDMNQFFWNAYKRLEKEVLLLSEAIHFSDDQLLVYSSKIGDLLVRTAIEVESLSKVLYFANGGKKPIGRDLYFDTDCMQLLEDKWSISKKTIFVGTPYFYFSEETNLTLHPLNKTNKRGTSSSKWQQAYQAVKHDRINNLKKGNVGNLLQALGSLYILNIYYRNANFETVADKDASNIDWGLGSEIFSVKISCEKDGASTEKIYEKKVDYEECIYLVKHTDESARAYINVMTDLNKKIQKQTLSDVEQELNKNIRAGELPADIDSILVQAKALINEKNAKAMNRVIQKEKLSVYNAIIGLRFEAVLNKHQF